MFMLRSLCDPRSCSMVGGMVPARVLGDDCMARVCDMVPPLRCDRSIFCVHSEHVHCCVFLERPDRLGCNLESDFILDVNVSMM